MRYTASAVAIIFVSFDGIHVHFALNRERDNVRQGKVRRGQQVHRASLQQNERINWIFQQSVLFKRSTAVPTEACYLYQEKIIETGCGRGRNQICKGVSKKLFV